MAFEDYNPRDRHISSRGHIASWLILAVLAGILAVAAPMANSSNMDHQIAAVPEQNCAV